MPPKKAPNPFYVALMVVSTLFVVTALAYLMGPFLQQRAAAGVKEGAGSRALADWLDRRGPLVLGVEIGIMLVTGTLAMLSEHWFSPRRGAARPPEPGGP